MPRHSDHLWTVVAVVRRPPVDRCGEQSLDVRLERREVDRGESRRVVEVRAERVGVYAVPVEKLDSETLRVPTVQGRRLTEGATEVVTTCWQRTAHVETACVGLVVSAH